MKKKIEEPKHPILERIKKVDKEVVDYFKDWPEEPQEFLDLLWEKYCESCKECVLSETRIRTTKWDGEVKKTLPKIMLISQGPGIAEDACGLPMVGSIEMRNSKYCGYCKNIYKCHDNRILKKADGWQGKRKAITCTPNIVEEPQLKNNFYLKTAGQILDGMLLNKWDFKFPRQNWIDTYNKLNPNKILNVESPWFITNIVLCHGVSQLTLKDLVPESASINACKKWLVAQWAAVNPDLIIAMGRPALEALGGGEKKVKNVGHGEIIQTKYGPVIFSLHIAHAMQEFNDNIKFYTYAKIENIFKRSLEYVGLL